MSGSAGLVFGGLVSPPLWPGQELWEWRHPAALQDALRKAIPPLTIQPEMANVSGSTAPYTTSSALCPSPRSGTGPATCPKWLSPITPLHISPLVCPFFLMFGQDPQLPVDFLFGRGQEPVADYKPLYGIKDRTLTGDHGVISKFDTVIYEFLSSERQNGGMVKVGQRI